MANTILLCSRVGHAWLLQFLSPPRVHLYMQSCIWVLGSIMFESNLQGLTFRKKKPWCWLAPKFSDLVASKSISQWTPWKVSLQWKTFNRIGHPSSCNIKLWHCYKLMSYPKGLEIHIDTCMYYFQGLIGHRRKKMKFHCIFRDKFTKIWPIS